MTIKPLYLLADSQLLFWKQGDRLFSENIREQTESASPSAAYIGASNGDEPAYYALFEAAMEAIAVSNCRMIPWDPSNADKAFLEQADLVLLAGGDVERGWRTFEQSGIRELIVRKRYEGVVLVGISAGAVQLGLGAAPESDQEQKIELFRFAPFYIGAHEEQDEWRRLRQLVESSPEDVDGIGIPFGGGAIYTPDGFVEPIRKPLIQFRKQGEQIAEAMIWESLPSKTS